MVQGLGAHASTHHLNIPPAARLDLVKITSEVSCAMHARQHMRQHVVDYCIDSVWCSLCFRRRSERLKKEAC